MYSDIFFTEDELKEQGFLQIPDLSEIKDPQVYEEIHRRFAYNAIYRKTRQEARAELPAILDPVFDSSNRQFTFLGPDKNFSIASVDCMDDRNGENLLILVESILKEGGVTIPVEKLAELRTHLWKMSFRFNVGGGQFITRPEDINGFCQEMKDHFRNAANIFVSLISHADCGAEKGSCYNSLLHNINAAQKILAQGLYPIVSFSKTQTTHELIVFTDKNFDQEISQIVPPGTDVVELKKAFEEFWQSLPKEKIDLFYKLADIVSKNSSSFARLAAGQEKHNTRKIFVSYGKGGLTGTVLKPTKGKHAFRISAPAYSDLGKIFNEIEVAVHYTSAKSKELNKPTILSFLCSEETELSDLKNKVKEFLFARTSLQDLFSKGELKVIFYQIEKEDKNIVGFDFVEKEKDSK